MKRFDIVTEIDARALEPGETIVLARGGHITPLASDTLKARRIAVLRDDGAGEESARLAPAADVRRLAIGSDHTGVALRRDLTAYLRSQGRSVEEVGEEIFAHILAIASGEATKSEQIGLGDEEFQPWILGPVL